jgi:hypothetical protein
MFDSRNTKTQKIENENIGKKYYMKKIYDKFYLNLFCNEISKYDYVQIEHRPNKVSELPNK